MNEAETGALLDQETLHDRQTAGYLPDWAVEHYDSFREGMLGERDGEPFPCYFGVESERAGDNFYTFVESTTHPDALFTLRRTLLEYLDRFPKRDAPSPLVAFFRPDPEVTTEADYHERLWNVLEFLHVHDPEPWPADIPTDPDDSRWEFCFAGTPMFPTCRAPFYDARMSRYCPVGLEITFQPRALFDGITADTEAGQHAREVIQSRIEAYDAVCPHADIGDWGVDGDREWPQYLLSGDPDQAPDECPLRVTRQHPKATVPEQWAVLGD
ncbi:YqcI/YcgG family protein [Halobium salinum]|uniref:YqcI/YcgG family protein n=1 Tax=Halobium salinum TaxID=1364940 RepID=A0ABD5P969_9EURY|nr:YqcI/YcgG family protein [Halobium salinum]